MKRLIMVSLGALLFSPMPGRVQAADTPPAAMSDTKKPDAGSMGEHRKEHRLSI